MDARFFRIRKWREFQHYRDRSPPWIKLHRNLLTSPTWVSSDDEGRTLAIACMLLAADTDNRIPADPDYLRRVAYLNSRPNLAALAATQFIEFIDEAGNPLADASALLADVCSETEQIRAEERQSTSEGSADAAASGRTNGEASPAGNEPEDGDGWGPPIGATPAVPVRRAPAAKAEPEAFSEIQALYPRRGGSQPWPRALKAAQARIREGDTWADLADGVRRYAAFIRATGKEGTEYVLQAATFFGPDKRYRESWQPPATKAEARYAANVVVAREWAEGRT